MRQEDHAQRASASVLGCFCRNTGHNDSRMDEPKPATTLADAIPELFYDIIVRVIPGFLMIAWFAYFEAWHGTIPQKITELNWAPATLLLIVSASAAYAAGMLVAPAGRWLTLLYYPRIFRDVASTQHDVIMDLGRHFGLRHIPQDATRLSRDALDEILTVELVDRTYQQMHDHLKERAGKPGALLAKKQAETIFCANLAAAAIWLLLISTIPYVVVGPTESFSRIQPIALAVIAAFGLLAGAQNSRRLVERHFSFWGNMYAERIKDAAAKSLAAAQGK